MCRTDCGKPLPETGKTKPSRDLLFYYVKEIKSTHRRPEEREKAIGKFLSGFTLSADCSFTDLIFIIEYADFDSEISRLAISQAKCLASFESDKDRIRLVVKLAKEKRKNKLLEEINTLYITKEANLNVLEVALRKFKLLSMSSSFDNADMRELILDAADIIVSHFISNDAQQGNLDLQNLVSLYNILPCKKPETNEKIKNAILDVLPMCNLNNETIFTILSTSECDFSKNFLAEVELTCMPTPSNN